MIINIINDINNNVNQERNNIILSRHKHCYIANEGTNNYKRRSKTPSNIVC